MHVGALVQVLQRKSGRDCGLAIVEEDHGGGLFSCTFENGDEGTFYRDDLILQVTGEETEEPKTPATSEVDPTDNSDPGDEAVPPTEEEPIACESSASESPAGTTEQPSSLSSNETSVEAISSSESTPDPSAASDSPQTESTSSSNPLSPNDLTS